MDILPHCVVCDADHHDEGIDWFDGDLCRACEERYFANTIAIDSIAGWADAAHDMPFDEMTTVEMAYLVTEPLYQSGAIRTHGLTEARAAFVTAAGRALAAVEAIDRALDTALNHPSRKSD